MTTGWKLDRQQRDELLLRFPPRYERAIADHVTLLSNQVGGATADPPGSVGAARIVGHADDGHGVEALVVAIDGGTARPDGGTWHVTWSLAEGRAARESNDAIARFGWAELDGGPLRLAPARW